MINIKEYIVEGSQKLSIPIQDSQIKMMETYASQLMIWNKKINLTAIKEPQQIADKHFLDSMAVVSHLQDDSLLMDMGSGGGFPGIVIKIMNPSIQMVLVDSVRKKVNFLKHVIRLLGLENIEAIQVRVEDLHNDSNYIHQFDGIVSRAFADLSKFVDLAQPLIKNNGSIYAMKGKQAAAEINPDIKKQFSISTTKYHLPFEKSERCVMVLNHKVNI